MCGGRERRARLGGLRSLRGFRGLRSLMVKVLSAITLGLFQIRCSVCCCCRCVSLPVMWLLWPSSSVSSGSVRVVGESRQLDNTLRSPSTSVGWTVAWQCNFAAGMPDDWLTSGASHFRGGPGGGRFVGIRFRTRSVSIYVLIHVSMYPSFRFLQLPPSRILFFALHSVPHNHTQTPYIYQSCL
jgi:hypothetical protein